MSQTLEAVTQKGTISCDEHPESALMFCSKHNAVFCSACLSLEHQDCSVTRISDNASEFLNGTTELTERIDRLRSNIKAKQLFVEENRQKANKNHLDNVEIAKAFRKEIEVYVARMEQNLLAECQKRREENEQIFKDIEQECSSVEFKLKSLQAENSTIGEQPTEKFVQGKEAEKKVAEWENCIKELDFNSQVQLFDLKRSPVLSEMMVKDIPIAELQMVVKQPRETAISDEKSTFENLRLERINRIYVRLPTDQSNCWITGITCLKNDKLACADCNNKSVKIVDVKRGVVTNRVTLEYSPRDIANIYDYQLAVTMDQEKKIEILMLHGLTKKYEIKVEGKCSGIVHKDRLLYVSYFDPPKIEVLYLEGDVWQRYTKDNFGVHMFNTPRYLDVAKNENYENYVVVTDWRRNYIHKVKLDVRKYRDTDKMNGLNAVVILPDESLLVCTENHKVHHISSDLTQSRTVLHDVQDNVANPEAMCFNPENNTLFLSNRFPGHYSDNIVQFKVVRP